MALLYLLFLTNVRSIPCVMGGGKRFAYPVDVWTPYGGWWPEGPSLARSRRNTVILYFVLAFGVFLPLGYISSRRERRYKPPIRFIPSQLWCKYAEIDDPRLLERKKKI